MKTTQATLKAFCVFLAVSAFVLHGHADSVTDVTALVQGAVKDGSLLVVANNETFGEPVFGVVKKLRVEYSIDGVADYKTVIEKSTLRIDVPAGKKLVITKATYGDLIDTNINVEETLNAAIKENKLTMLVDNDLLGGDPAPGLGKTLVVSYTVDGKAYSTNLAEGDSLILPKESDGTGKLVITKAIYGTN